MSQLEMSRSAVKAYLNTVVVFDDRAVLPRPTPDDMILEPEERPNLNTRPPETAESKGKSLLPGVESNSHDIDIVTLVSAFAAVGIVCAPLIASADGMQDLIKIAVSVARRADVLVVDWSWGGDDGTKCSNLLGKINDDTDPGRQQLVVIYTGNDADSLKQNCQKRLEGVLGKADPGGTCVEALQFAWRKRGLDVVVLQKPNANTPLSPHSLVQENELPDRIIDLFAGLRCGILADATMQALGAVRNETHRVLTTFCSSHDPAFVVHRAFTVPRQGADDQVRDLISEAIRDVISDLPPLIDDSKVLTYSKKLLDSHNGQKELTALSLTAEDLADGFTNPKRPAAKKYSEEKDEKFLPKLTNCLSGDNKPENGLQRHQDLGATIYARVNPPSFAPKLVAGVIVRRDKEYLFCLLPACDAERVPKEGLLFPFAVAKERTDGKGADIVITVINQHSGCPETKAFAVEKKWAGLRQLEFSPKKPGEPVISEQDPKTKQWIFCSKNGESIDYVGKTRPLITQQLIDRFANWGSRIGIMESEYHRRLRGRG